MVNEALAQNYFKRCKIRVEILEEFFRKKAFSDVIREAQEVVELLEKAILIKMGINPPKWHDVIDVIIEHKEELPEKVKKEIIELKNDCKYLRSQRELAFYGEADFIPDDFYSEEDAKKAIEIAQKMLRITEKIFREKK